MLTDSELKDISKKMKVPLVGVVFKDSLPSLGKLQYNKSYIINLENTIDEDGNVNEGSHYTCFQVNKLKNGKVQALYFDSMGRTGVPPDIISYIGFEPPQQTMNLQSIVAETCGYWCLSWLYFINSFPERTNDMYEDTSLYLDLFNDLNKECDYKHNEYVLKNFFRSVDPELREPIESDYKRIE